MVSQGSKEWWANLATFVAFNASFGFFGADRFYRGQVGWGVVKLITFGGFFLWWLIDALIGTYRLGQTGQWTRSVPEARGTGTAP